MSLCHILRALLLIVVLITPCSTCFAYNIGTAKRDLPNGYPVSWQGMSVTAVFGGCLYIEQADRAAAIRVDTPITLASTESA